MAQVKIQVGDFLGTPIFHTLYFPKQEFYTKSIRLSNTVLPNFVPSKYREIKQRSREFKTKKIK